MSTKEEHEPWKIEVTIPQGITASLKGFILKVKGPLGESSKDFSKIPVRIFQSNGKITIQSYRRRKRDYAMVNTVHSHIKNMILGVTEGFTYRLKVVFAHFPISIKVKNQKVCIENFYGERAPRVAEIVGDCKVSVEGDDIIVKGVSKEDVGQTAANLEQVTKVKRKDQRVFLDGVYIYTKGVGV